MGSCKVSSKSGAMTGSKLAKVGMASTKSGGAKSGQGNTTSSNMKK